MEYMVAIHTDQGIRRATNQDSACFRRAMLPSVGEVVMAVICDGMGGLEKGELASAECVLAFENWFDANLPHLASICDVNFSFVQRQWIDLLSHLHNDLLAYGKKTQSQIGTTVSAILTYRDRYLTVNIGDSRIYERKDALIQLTEDHSLVASEIASGKITQEESRHHPQRNILLQCLGCGTGVVPAFCEGKIRHNALYLLCTDGLVHEITPRELSEQLQPLYLRSKEAMADVLYRLTELCKERGEDDNISAMLIKTQESHYREPKGLGLWRALKKERPQGNAPACPALIESAQMIHTDERIHC